jgi:twinkle protein
MLVAHMRKSESEDKPSGKMGVKGSGGITDMAATVIEVWRNKAREKAIARAANPDDPQEIPEKYQPLGECGADALLLVLKQNATGKEPCVRLWFDPESTQFLAQHHHNPRPMISYSAMAMKETA